MSHYCTDEECAWEHANAAVAIQRALAVLCPLRACRPAHRRQPSSFNASYSTARLGTHGRRTPAVHDGGRGSYQGYRIVRVRFQACPVPRRTQQCRLEAGRLTPNAVMELRKYVCPGACALWDRLDAISTCRTVPHAVRPRRRHLTIMQQTLQPPSHDCTTPNCEHLREYSAAGNQADVNVFTMSADQLRSLTKVKLVLPAVDPATSSSMVVIRLSGAARRGAEPQLRLGSRR